MGKPRLVWTKPKSYGYASPKACNLRISGDTIATVQELRGGGWFWYAMSRSIPGRNTAHEPVETLDEAKAEAMAWVKKAMEPSDA